MKIKMTRAEIVNWIEGTVNEIKELLQKEQIPYTDSWTKDDTVLHPTCPYYTHQLLFPWDEGDVVIGLLHCSDDDIILGRREIAYPSIETYRFPWDADDITVFDTPEEFVKALKAYYISKKETKMTREQAAKVIENMPISHECREFFDLALEALRQQEVIKCKDCEMNNQCSIQFKFAYADAPGDWFCAYAKRKEGQ